MKYSDYKLFERGDSFNPIGKQSLKLDPTPPDILGPFYLPNAPMRDHLSAATRTKPLLTISGSILSTDGDPIVGALLEVWQAGPVGNYDNDPVSMNFRGNQFSDEKGDYTISTIIPGDYKISDPGEPDDFRCAHIHFRITATGYKMLVTQLYFPDDKYNATDHWFDKRRVIVPPNATFDFILERGSD